MVQFNSDLLTALLASFFWPFVRILALIGTDPVFGSRSIPAPYKIGFAVLITLALMPILPTMPAVSPFSAYGLLVMTQQVIIGMAMGLVMRVVFTAIEMAGHLAGLQMGLGFAMFFDPTHGTQVPVVSQITSLFGILTFFALDGHLVVLATLVQSFQVLPIQLTPLSAGAFKLMFKWGEQIFIMGLTLSMPVVAALLVANMAIGVMTRASPQFNLFAVGFPLTMGIGFVAFYFSLPYWTTILRDFFNLAGMWMLQVLKLMNGAH
ncbi:flagellar biosynthetic protein FliR [Chitinivorax tropicus]|uniref:Flagellar biosynthetic protein FliR n=1 Tax=Chitinivorax tropicus TaxID=714531 RepID=A0A840MTN7_9PROT|nr:flagellar biosynthetic protein FliR [Chitinivorax tropicus]MBB5020449.1 flagellar biosynthetic protein FliR [Chitinivorax tropicus]